MAPLICCYCNSFFFFFSHHFFTLPRDLLLPVTHDASLHYLFLTKSHSRIIELVYLTKKQRPSAKKSIFIGTSWRAENKKGQSAYSTSSILPPHPPSTSKNPERKSSLLKIKASSLEDNRLEKNNNNRLLFIEVDALKISVSIPEGAKHSISVDITLFFSIPNLRRSPPPPKNTNFSTSLRKFMYRAWLINSLSGRKQKKSRKIIRDRIDGAFFSPMRGYKSVGNAEV